MKKNKNNLDSSTSSRYNWTAAAVKSPLTLMIFGVLAVALGIFFIVMQRENTPVPREEAIAYEGEFAEYEVWDNYRTLYFTDGTSHSVYPHTETTEFRKAMQSLEVGTKLYIMVHPQSGNVIEIRTDTEELLNFEASQAAIDRYDNGYVAIGICAIACGVFLAVYGIVMPFGNRKEERRQEARRQKQKSAAASGLPDTGLRRADMTVKHRVLLEATFEGYRICYRRVKSVNELVVNGVVYDEMKAVVEFPHDLTVTLDGHRIHAGLDEDDFSYIIVDGERIAEKKRWI